MATHAPTASLFGALLLGFSILSAGAADGHPVQIRIQPQFRAAPLELDALVYTNTTGQRLAISRLDYLVSQPALRRSDGVWIRRTNDFAYLSARNGLTEFRLTEIPAGRYDQIQFTVGVPERENHADPAQFAADHPLNPNRNGLHWNWQGGYVFLALEGLWLAPPIAGTNSDRPSTQGFSYHLATDPMQMHVTLPLILDVAGAMELELALNVERIFAGPHPIGFSSETATTHSRPNDPLAAALRMNVESAFAVARVQRSPPVTTAVVPTARHEIAVDATPYRLSFSRQFPRPSLPADNPLTEEGVALGQELFQDARLSINDRQSCAHCHPSNHAFVDPNRFSLGAEGQTGTRNAQPLFNLAWKSAYFWDGRATSLRAQVLQPIQNPIEMHESLPHVVAKLTTDRALGERFKKAFGTTEITADWIARALEQFLLTLIADDSKFDRFLAGTAELSADEKRGFQLFNTEYDPRREQFGADCFHCHGGPLFQSQSFANNGLDRTATDPGRESVTGRSGDHGRFAVPSLRNVAVTAPYMHDGRFASLEAVVAHYGTGIVPSPNLDPNLAKHPVGGVPLSAADQQALVAFLRTLTDQRWLGLTQDPSTPARP